MTKTNHTPKQNHLSQKATSLKSTDELELLDDGDLAQAKTDKLHRRTAEQNAQARLVLIQLQGLLIALMMGAMVWLGMSHQKLSKQVDERLKIAESLTTRMNTIDDRLFSMTSNNDIIHKVSPTSQSNDQLIIIQLKMAQTLTDQGDYQEAMDMLSLIALQLEQMNFDMSISLASSLQSAIKTDIKRLSALDTQNPWQADIAVLKDVSGYLRTLDGSGMTYADLVLHDARMLVSLSIGAAVMKERDTLVVHLTETVSKLNELKKLKDGSSSDLTKEQEDKDASITTQEVKDIAGAIMAINRLLASPPHTYHLTSLAIITT